MICEDTSRESAHMNLDLSSMHPRTSIDISVNSVLPNGMGKITLSLVGASEQFQVSER